MSEQGSSSSPLSSATFDEYNSKLQASALKATRNAATLPADISFYRSLDTGLAQDIDSIASRALNLTNKLLELASSLDTNGAAKGKGKGKARLGDQDDVAENFHSLVVDVMDQLFERTDTCLDQVLGRNKPAAIAINPAPLKQKTAITTKKALNPVIHHASQLPKPQLSFKRKPDNGNTPWYPSISHKYNAKVPLGYAYTDREEDASMDASSAILNNHPYRYEINHISYPSHVYTTTTPIPPLSFSETPFTWVSTPDALHAMLNILRTAKEIAVDLEHYDYRSYSGFLCLMQISIREEDFVIDVIALRDEMEVLNEVFTDPKIVKVFHGAESDIVWLQQDFNLYVVNLFDTFHASKLLDFPRHSLANLLEMYCDFVPDKRYQLADWRIRPLPEEMLEYARSDTHFLLFIYDNLRNALLDRAASRSRSSSPPTTATPANASASNNKSTSHTDSNFNSKLPILCTPPPTANASTNPAHIFINHVLTRSAETCLRVYVKESYDHAFGSGSNGWDTLAKKWNKPFFTVSTNSFPLPSSLSDPPEGYRVLSMQKAVYISIHGWRDRVAREEDESTRYVLPNQYLFRIAQSPPGDLNALLRIFGTQVPSVVKRRAKELLDNVREAVRQSLGAEEKGEGKEVEKVEEVDKPREEEKRVEQVEKDTGEMLWGTDKTNEMIKTSSSLFEKPKAQSSIPLPDASERFSSRKSTLFGNIKNVKAPSIFRDQTPAGSSRFQQVATRIHSALVIVPTVPKMVTSTITKEVTTTETLEEATGMQIEIPFIPSNQRQTKPTTLSGIEEKERDTIIIVGKPKSKKRKRGKSTVTVEVDEGSPGTGGGEETNDGGEEGVTAAAFDFASVPNILDDNPDVEVSESVKKKQKKGKGRQFPAPPKAHSEFKGGQQSHSFK